ncbi:MAG: MFS transporter [Legionella sp.]|nr:MFS transporter [Legionella sp.]
MWIETFRDKIFRTMGVKVAEQRRVYLSFLLTFTTGALLCYISSFPLALFLIHNGSKTLPQIYLAVAFLLIFIGFAYTFLEYRLAFNKLIIGLIFIISFVLVLLGTALINLNNNWIILLLLVWAIVAYGLLELCIWSVINRIYNMQQAKNSFGIIGAFQSIGGVLAGFTSPLLVSLVGLNYLIIGIGLLAVLVAFIIWFLLLSSGASEESPPDQEQEEEVNPSIKTVVHNKYILKIFILVLLGVSAKYSIDLLFNTAAELRFSKEEELAGFLGIFFGLVDGADLIFSLTLFGWCLKRLGIVLTLFILPTLGICISLPIALLSDIPTFVNVLFWLIVTLKLFEESLRTSLTEIGTLLLLQPFPRKLRSFLQSKLELFILGISTALISILLIIITNTIGASVWILALLGLGCYALVLCILFTLKTDYVSAVTKAIANHFYERGQALSLSKEDLELFEKYLSSTYPDEIIYALEAIEKIDLAEFSKKIPIALQAQNPYVDQFIIDKIKQHKLMQQYPVLISFLHNKNEKLIIAALDAAATLDYEPIQSIIQEMSHSSSLTLLCPALIILINYEDDTKIRAIAINQVHELCRSNDPEKRAIAAHILGLISDRVLVLLTQLTEDTNNKVRDNAFRSVLNLKDDTLYSSMIRNLNFISMKPEFITRFKEQINTLQPLIEHHFETLSAEIQIKILNLLGQIKDETSKTFIEHCALSPNLALREVALKTLNHFKRPFNPGFIEALHKQIKTEALYLKEQYQYYLTTPKIELTDLLCSVLNRKIHNAIERIMLALSLSYDMEIIEQARKGLKSKSGDEKGYAIELIDTLLDSTHKKIISPLLVEIFLMEQQKAHSLDSKAFQHVVIKNIQYKGEEPIELLTCMACIYIVVKGDIKKCFTQLEQLNAVNSPLIQETLTWLRQNQ